MSNVPDSFFTVASLGTFAGATAVAHVLRSTVAALMGITSPWVAFLTSLAASIGALLLTGSPTSVSDYLIAFLNGCLIFLTVIGSTQVVHRVTPDPARPQSDGNTTRFQRAFHSPIWGK